MKTRRREVDVEIEVRKREKEEKAKFLQGSARTSFPPFGQVSGSELLIMQPISIEYQQVT